MLVVSIDMYRLLLSSTVAVAAIATAFVASPAFAQTQGDLKARCDQLISFFDRYGASRSENSDGARNHTRIGAGIDCERGRYKEAIAAMEDLLKRKNFDVPPAPTGLAQTPSATTPQPAR